MGQERLKRPRVAKRRTIPPDAASLVEMIKSVHRELVQRAEHLKRESHDYRSRQGLRFLHDQRSGAFARLIEIDPGKAMSLAGELGLVIEVS